MVPQTVGWSFRDADRYGVGVEGISTGPITIATQVPVMEQ